MNFINNWRRAIALPAGVTVLDLDLPDGNYRLTVADSDVPPARYEIVQAVVAGGVASLIRGQEGTDDQEWPAGSVIICAVTAGIVDELFQRIAALEEVVFAPGPGDPFVFYFSLTPAADGSFIGFGPGYGAVTPASIDVPGVGALHLEYLDWSPEQGGYLSFTPFTAEISEVVISGGPIPEQRVFFEGNSDGMSATFDAGAGFVAGAVYSIRMELIMAEPLPDSSVAVDVRFRRYNAYGWVSSPGAVGATNPAFMSVVPGTGSSPGAVGEILSLQWAGGSLYLYVRGSGGVKQIPAPSLRLMMFRSRL